MTKRSDYLEKVSKIRVQRDKDFIYDTEKVKSKRFTHDLSGQFQPLYHATDTNCVLRADKVTNKGFNTEQALNNAFLTKLDYFYTLRIIKK
jgi:hypothetical protein